MSAKPASGASPGPASSLVKHGSVLSLLTLASRVLGLVREMTKASLLGTSALSDAFSVAFMLPNLFRRLFAEGSITAAFIPTFKEYLIAEAGGMDGGGAREGSVPDGGVCPHAGGLSPAGGAVPKRRACPRLGAMSPCRGSVPGGGVCPHAEGLSPAEGPVPIREFLSCIFTFLSFFVSLAVGIGILAAPLIVPVFGMEAPDETVLLTRIMFPFLAFISIAALFQGILNSLRIFAPSGLAPILLNLATIVFAYALSPFMANPARAMAVGILAGGFLEAAVQFPFVLKTGYRFFFTGLKRAIGNPGTKKVLRLVGPTIIGMAAYQLNDLVSTALAGSAGEGIVSSLQYSLRLQELILGVFAVSIGTVLLPDLAGDAKTGNWPRYNERLISAMDIIALITIPITFFSLAQGETLIRLLFQSRSFDERSVALTLAAFRFHMPGLFFIALNRILAPAFYAQSDSRSPTLAGIISFAVNMVLAAVLVRPMRGTGVALALSVASAVNTALLLAFSRRNPNITVGKALRPVILYAAKLAVFSALAAIPVLLFSPRLVSAFAGTNRVIALGIPFVLSAVIFAAVGITLLALTRDRQFAAIARALRGRKE